MAAAPTMKPISPLKLIERQTQQQVKDFLKLRQWRIMRNQVGVATSGVSTFGFGEKGMPDLLAIYYIGNSDPRLRMLTLSLWIETKRPGRPLNPDQIAWKTKEEARGSLVWKVDNLDEFMADYEAIFGWLHSVSWLQGQKWMDFEEAVAGMAEYVKSAKGKVTCR